MSETINFTSEQGTNTIEFSAAGVASAVDFTGEVVATGPQGPPGQDGINGTNSDGAAAWGLIEGTLSNQADLQAILDAKLTKTSNLSDVSNAITARANLGVAIGANVEAYVAPATTSDYLRGDKTFHNFDDAVQANSLNTLAPPTGPITMLGQKITNVGAPSAGTDVATKAYADAVGQGLTVKDSVVAATTVALDANTYLAGVITANANGALALDDISPIADDRLLVKNEVTAANNGIYVVTDPGDGSNPFVLTRAADMNASAEVRGAFTFVGTGTINANSGWVVSGIGPFTLGTTAIPFAQFSGAGTIAAGHALSKTGSTLAVVEADLTGIPEASVTNLTTDLAAKVAKSTLTTKGDLYAASGSATPIRVGVGTDGQVLTSDAASTAGVKWADDSTPDASSIVKGKVQLTAALGGTADAPTTPTAVHITGDETVAGVKTFSSSPIAPTPTASTQVANKTYVDSAISGSISNATFTTAGKVKQTVYNVTDYGALGDGSTNDYTAIMLAINTCNTAGGGTVYFPLGVYRTSTSIIVPNSGHIINLIGVGIDATIIKGSGSLDPVLAHETNGVIQDMTVDGNGQAQNVLAILVPGSGTAIDHVSTVRVKARGTKTAGQWVFVAWDQTSSYAISVLTCIDCIWEGPTNNNVDDAAITYVDTAYLTNITVRNISRTNFYIAHRIFVDGMYVYNAPNFAAFIVDSTVDYISLANVFVDSTSAAPILCGVKATVVGGRYDSGFTIGQAGGVPAPEVEITGSKIDHIVITGDTNPTISIDNVRVVVAGTAGAAIYDTRTNGTTLNYLTVTNSYFDATAAVGSRWLGSANGTTWDKSKINNNTVVGVSTALYNITQGTQLQAQNNGGVNPEILYAQGNVTGATTFNRTNGNVITATLTGNITVTATSGVVKGDEMSWVLTQDGTGSRTISLPGNVKAANGGLTLSTTASAVDVITFVWDGTNWREKSRALAVAPGSGSFVDLTTAQTIGGAKKFSTNMQVAAEDSYLAIDDASTAPRLGFVKKSGNSPFVGIGSGQAFKVRISSGADISAGGTWTDILSISSVGTVTATAFSGPLTGAVTGNVTGNVSGSAATLATPRAIYGNNFDGSAALTQVIASTYGGTGNGFAKLSGPASTEKTFTLPNASATILTDNAAVTVAQGGTGQATANAGFNALSPMTTAGDIIYGGTSGAGTRLAAGTTSQVLVGGTTPSWASQISADNSYFGVDTTVISRMALVKKSGNNPWIGVGSATNFVVAKSSTTSADPTSTYTNLLSLDTNGTGTFTGGVTAQATSTFSASSYSDPHPGNTYDAKFGGNQNGIAVTGNSLMGQITITDAKNIVLNTTTGTKIGTATSQKLSVYNATPVIQAIATTDLGVVLSDFGLRAAGTAWPLTTTGNVSFGNVTLGTAGNKISITTGSNASVGTGTLVGGTATISTTAVTANSLIFLQDTAGTITNVGTLTVSAKTAGTSFVVTSTLALDTSTFNWWIIN